MVWSCHVGLGTEFRAARAINCWATSLVSHRVWDGVSRSSGWPLSQCTADDLKYLILLYLLSAGTVGICHHARAMVETESRVLLGRYLSTWAPSPVALDESQARRKLSQLETAPASVNTPWAGEHLSIQWTTTQLCGGTVRTHTVTWMNVANNMRRGQTQTQSRALCGIWQQTKQEVATDLCNLSGENTGLCWGGGLNGYMSQSWLW